MNQPIPPTPAIRIVIVGGSPETAGLCELLEFNPLIKVIGSADHAIAALKLCDNLKPDLVVMTLMSPVCDGVIGTRLLKSCIPEIKVMLIVRMEEREMLNYAHLARADGCLLLPVSFEKIFTAIKNIIFKDE